VQNLALSVLYAKVTHGDYRPGLRGFFAVVWHILVPLAA
jgi:hypothetical protein